MTGRGKGGKGLGKVERSVTGKCSAITSRASPSRLSVVCCRGGVKRIRSDLRRDARSAESVPRERDRDAVTYTEHAKRKTVTGTSFTR
ncbi:Histone H4 [Eumeta japonica]|uniref:Histone H4 n=1 Tax=Eumeta variegata TaxID=151549 RepID=A0A4C1XIW8_EUMVA|nr:Histone H4 [Eumeta japonica]